MTWKRLQSDRRGVSPVIGVILMVAITVILAAVIGTFVLGLGDQVGDSAPQASFDFDFKNDSAMTITHEGGDKLQNSNLQVIVGSNTSYDGGLASGWDNAGGSDWGTEITAGTTQSLHASDDNDFSGETVRIVWSSSSSGETSTIAKADWP